jgi:lipopolysaccharide transport protein LptA
MLYEENSRTARYSGGVTLKRGNLEVVSDRLRAVLKTGDEGAALETAYAEGAVRIRQQTAGRSRTGTGEYAEYAVHEERVALWGGNPEFVDSARGATRGARLTWYAANDRLLVDGAEGSPARSRILR